MFKSFVTAAKTEGQTHFRRFQFRQIRGQDRAMKPSDWSNLLKFPPTVLAAVSSYKTFLQQNHPTYQKMIEYHGDWKFHPAYYIV